MKLSNLLIFTCLFLLLKLTAVAQTADLKPESWQVFQPEKDIFSVEVPAEMKTSTSGIPPEQRYSALHNGTYFFIFSENPKTPNSFIYVDNFLKNHLSSAKLSNLGDLENVIYNFSDNESYFHSILVIKTSDRVLTFHLVSPCSDNYLVERFFKTLKIVSKEKSFSINNKNYSASDLLKINNNKQMSELKSQNSNIPCKDQQMSHQSKQIFLKKPESVPVPNQPDSNLKILTKPTSSYTEPARFYRIEGNVLLKVTFLANGEIGAITPTARLPFGLTEKTIETARRITFSPMVKDGKTVTITKTVQYTYTIY